MSALLDDVGLSVLTAVIARGELLTNGDAQRLRGHIEALNAYFAARQVMFDQQSANLRRLAEFVVVQPGALGTDEGAVDIAIRLIREATR